AEGSETIRFFRRLSMRFANPADMPYVARPIVRPFMGTGWQHSGVSVGALLLASSMIVPATPAQAQHQTPRATTLEMIIVTARKRTEDLQDVPISVSVLEGDDLRVPVTASNAGLARAVPNFNFVDLGGQSGNLANVRG